MRIPPPIANPGPDPTLPYRDALDGVYPGSRIGAEFFNATASEMTTLITRAGLTPSQSDLLQVAKAVRSNRMNWLTVGGTANALTLTPVPAFASLAELTGVPLRFIATGTPTAAPNFVVSGLTAMPFGDAAGYALGAGAWVNGDMLEVIFDGTVYRLQGFAGGAKLPVYPEVLTGSGALTMSHASGVLTVTGAVLRLRGYRDINLAALATLTFNTAASKTYHLRYDPTNGMRLLDLVNGGAYNPSSLAENNAAFDSGFDDALLARIVTNGSNVATITTLANKHRLNLRADISTNTAWSITSAQRATFQGTVALNWGRAPVMPATTVFVTWSTGPSQATMSGGHRWESMTYDRYGVAWSVSADWNDNDTSIAAGTATMLCSGSFFIGTNF